MKKLKLISIIFISITLIGSVYISGCLNYDNQVNTITALEGKSTAEEVAENWHKDAELKDVGSMGIVNNREGRSTKWVYVYFSNSSTKIEDNVTKHEHIHIYITPSKEVSKTTGWNVITDEDIIIKNWTIDSDEAVDIAKQEPQIESYLDEYPRASLGMTLMMWEKLPDGIENPNQDSATWSIGWSDSGGMFDDPAHARVFINANTGEVLYVDPDI